MFFRIPKLSLSELSPDAVMPSRSIQGGGRLTEIRSFFRLKARSEGCRLAAATHQIGAAGRLVTFKTEPAEAPIHAVSCGKVPTRTSGLIRPVRLLHISSYSAGTRSRRKRIPHQGGWPAIDWRSCSFEETKKREFRRQAHVSADDLLARTGVCWGSIDFV